MEIKQRISEYLEIINDNVRQEIHCRKCGQSFGPTTENWKKSRFVIKKVSPLDVVMANIPPHELVEFRQYICPGCATLLSTEVALKNEPELWEFRPAVTD